MPDFSHAQVQAEHYQICVWTDRG